MDYQKVDLDSFSAARKSSFFERQSSLRQGRKKLAGRGAEILDLARQHWER
jgi:hypothetical protein